ncbi:hypothetical protein ACFVYG_19700 [Streptomyces sp. NPDC058256]|uniref:hypothetical protein n=1 Tax=Streptomyces sp. NPDC058256 TaxID=3346408 RepID=UPI0036EA20C9
MHGDGREGRTSRTRMWGGVLALAVGSYIAGDAAHRLHAAAAIAADWWPWALLGLAALNLLRSALPVGSLIGPLLLAAVALGGLAASGGVAHETLADRVVPCALALMGAALVLSAGRAAGTTRVLSTGRVDIRNSPSGPLALRAVIGELRADLSETGHAGVVLHVTAIGGHVRLTVPRDALVRIHDTGAVLTRIRAAPEVRPAESGQVFDIHVLGVCGAVSVVGV